jgi:osmotically-inducible protein OsmY
MQHTSTLVRRLAAALAIGAVSALAHAADTTTAAPVQMVAAATATDDATITTQVQAALQQDRSLSAIGVSTTAGVVLLNGSASSSAAVQQAIKLAMTVPGVKDVKNEIKVGG